MPPLHVPDRIRSVLEKIATQDGYANWQQLARRLLDNYAQRETLLGVLSAQSEVTK